ncbi:hypothetical protein ACFPH6_04060 [Streptomyces xiangluensis]|uniref:Uncharacterized protein n=1 Tax=Streptomyces xiangluensis TaxID=2665720 RepID=A0ABV8YG98_9ACTN
MTARSDVQELLAGAGKVLDQLRHQEKDLEERLAAVRERLAPGQAVLAAVERRQSLPPVSAEAAPAAPESAAPPADLDPGPGPHRAFGPGIRYRFRRRAAGSRSVTCRATASTPGRAYRSRERTEAWRERASSIGVEVPPSARHQRGHRPQPKGLLRRRRQLPCVPHQLTHAGINDPEHLPFRINSESEPVVDAP